MADRENAAADTVASAAKQEGSRAEAAQNILAYQRGACIPVNRRVHAFWCRYPSRANFGDAITPWLIHKITGRHPIFAWPASPIQKYLVVGSIVRYATKCCTVWGTGIISRNDLISAQAEFVAVRGPLTRRRALQCGVSCPTVFGDPALLLPRFHRPKIHRTEALIGILPHFSHQPKVSYRWRRSSRLRLIDIQRPVEQVIDEICSCHFIVTSSLHGLIAANAYGIPARWVEFNDPIQGDGTKFLDYFLAAGQPIQEPLRLEYDAFDADFLESHLPDKPKPFDGADLWKACPFRELC